MTEYARPDGNAEIRDYARIMAQAFAGPPDVFAQWAVEFGVDNVRVMRDDEVRAGLVIYRMGQYFGGCSIPTWGIAGVAVTPELRGRGIAREMMLANLRENFEHGPPISTLWPATTQLYRALGWETAGTRNTYSVRLANLPRGTVDASIRPADDADDALVRGLYARRYAACTGCLDRSDAIWGRINRAPKDVPLYRYIVEVGGEAQGYVIYEQARRTPRDYVFDVVARDLVALSPVAARELAGTFAAHRSVAEELHFYGAPNDPWLMQVLNSQKVAVRDRLDWMLRIVRVKDALESRGYPKALSGEAAFEITDRQLAGNAGNWTVAVDGGTATVSQGARPGPQLDIGGLSALFAGRLLPRDLRMAGLMEGDERHDDLLAAMFAGPPPWMPDFF